MRKSRSKKKTMGKSRRRKSRARKKTIAQKRADCRSEGLVYDNKLGKCRRRKSRARKKTIAQKRADCRSEGLVYDNKLGKCRRRKTRVRKKPENVQKFDGQVNIEKDCKIKNDMIEFTPLINHKNIMKKIYKNWNGSCFDISQLVDYLISSDGKNKDPMIISDKLWRNKTELKNLMQFIDEPFNGIPESKKKKIKSILNEANVPSDIDVIIKHLPLLEYIFKAGCVAISDNPSSHELGIYKDSAIILGTLANKLDLLSKKRP